MNYHGIFITYQGIDIKQNKLLILVAYLMRQCLVNQWLTKINSRLNYLEKSTF